LIDSIPYVETVKKYFSFLETEFHIAEIGETINGNAFYDVQYKGKTKIISISYENIEDYLQVIVFILENGILPDYDDKSKTLHLSALNKIAFAKASKDDFKINNSFFSQYSATNEFERNLLKASKDLRLCLVLTPDLR
jgi:hypothetical protein